MRVTKLPARGRDYDSGRLHTKSYLCFPEVIRWLRDIRTVKQRVRVSERMCDFHRDRFRTLWGKPSFCWTGTEYNYCWLLNLDDKATVLAVTAKDRGTTYELVDHLNGLTPVTNDLDVVLRFFKEVICK